MLFGLVIEVHVAHMLFGEKIDDSKEKKLKKDNIKYQLLRSKQRLAKLTEVNKVYNEQINKLKGEIDALRECINFQKNLINDRQQEFEHLESVNGVCHCNECIETDIKANIRADRRSVKKCNTTEELWME
ncbi:unnamed protein product [Owenia fusiformis]|uniref:Uncharacterized protein n=1 Tax=Owenia fusiformis TaxID=6347 RepID=A0A8J1UVC3_OWEFU|nr:unnamed protein product [Owenia fusiformis]